MHEDVFDENGDIVLKKALEWTSSRCSGTVAGLVEIHSRFGTLPWKDL